MIKPCNIKEIIESDKPLFSFGKIDMFLGNIYLFYGESLTGKTSISLSIAKEYLKRGYTILYIDTENKIKTRLRKIYEGDIEKFFQNFFLFSTSSLTDFEKTFKEIEEFIKEKNIKLLVIDSIYSPYQGVEHPKQRAFMIKNIFKKIKVLAEKYNLTAILTTHCYRSYSSGNSCSFLPIGGEGINFYSDWKFLLRPAKPPRRIIRNVVEDKESVIQINNNSLVEWID